MRNLVERQTSRSGTSKREKLRWAHVSSVDVNSALNGLLENAVVALPESCVQSSGIQPNISDKNKPKKLWLGRLRYLRYLLSASLLQENNNPDEFRKTMLQAAVSTVELSRRSETTETEESIALAVKFANMSDDQLRNVARAAVTIQSAWRGASARKGQRILDILDDYFSDCLIKGCVLLVCGSTGIAGDSLRYIRMLAGQGYLVVAPDHLAGNSDFFSRQDAFVLLRYEDTTDYWQRNILYNDKQAQGELTYSSSTSSVLSDPEHFDKVYNNIITIRQAGVSLILRRLPEFMKRHGIFCFGMSEGAVVLSSFSDDMYTDIIRGRILCSYSCEQNYWNYNRPEDAGIAGSPTIPTLNIMGYVDEYFGYQDSVASSVASCGNYPSISGHAFDAMVAAGIEWGLVAHLEGGRHALTFTHDAVIRELLSDFLERPQYSTRMLPQLWSHVHNLRDEINRVRRSADNKVTYIRIRHPDPGTVVPQQGSESGWRLLEMLNLRLHQLESDQPLSPIEPLPCEAPLCNSKRTSHDIMPEACMEGPSTHVEALDNCVQNQSSNSNGFGNPAASPLPKPACASSSAKKLHQTNENNEPASAELPRLIVNSSLANAANSQKEGLFVAKPLAHLPNHKESEHDGQVHASLSFSHEPLAPTRFCPAAAEQSMHRGYKNDHTAPGGRSLHQQHNCLEQSNLLQSSSLSAHLQENQVSRPGLEPLITEAESSQRHSDGLQDQNLSNSELKDITSFMSSQVKALAAAHESLRDLANASAAIAIAGAVSSIVTALAVAALVGSDFFRKRQ